MSWTAPATATTGQNVTAAFWNAQIRDNFLETSAATVTTAGDIAYADAANSMGSRLAIGAATTHLVSTGSAPVWRAIATDREDGTSGQETSTSYIPLDSGGWQFPANIDVTVITGTIALVLFKARLANNTGGSVTFLSYAVSGATTVAASDAHSIDYESSNADDFAEFGGFDLRTGLTAGSNTFTLEGRVTAGSGKITRPEIAVIAF